LLIEVQRVATVDCFVVFEFIVVDFMKFVPVKVGA